MNIETGELKQFLDHDDLEKTFRAMSLQERENWIEVDSKKITAKQAKKRRVESADHRSELAVTRDILRKQKRSARRKAKRKEEKPFV
jgi:hypothetical protein